MHYDFHLLELLLLNEHSIIRLFTVSSNLGCHGNTNLVLLKIVAIDFEGWAIIYRDTYLVFCNLV